MKIINSQNQISEVDFAGGGSQTFWHSTSHLLAAAVKRLYPQAKLAIGPAIDAGFYYDFLIDKPFSAEDLTKIETEMRKIAKENLKFEAFTLPREEALALVKGEPLKIELINDLPKDEPISFFKIGDFTDLCAGPHVTYTSGIKAIKLLSSTSAYWRGDSSRENLQRIYGISFPKAAELEEHLQKLEEAKTRDHNVLGRSLGFFTTHPAVGQGLPLLTPKGSKVVQILQRLVEDEGERRGYNLVKTPIMAKSDLYKISGHWQKYKDGMFVIDDDYELALRPMTCPFQFMIYKSDLHSYKDLPVRYLENATLFRNEHSGEMHGLIRVRQFTLSDGHIICTPQSLEHEFNHAMKFITDMIEKVGLSDEVYYCFSKWDANNPDKYLGEPEEWEQTQDLMRGILQRMNLNFYEEDGEAAFYGPKLDIQMKNVYGKEDTIFTLQIDFALAKRFDMTYIDEQGEKQNPYVIHHSVLGAYERLFAMLIEKYAGALPLWLAPVQAIILPISDKFAGYANEVADKLRAANLRTEIDSRAEKIGYKIRAAQLSKIPFMIIVGEKESESGLISVRSREKGDLGQISTEDFLAAL